MNSMLKLNDLRITPDSEYLILDVEIEDIPNYADISIDSVIIDYQDTYVSGSPSNKAIYNYPEEKPENCIEIKPDGINLKHLKMCLNKEDLKNKDLKSNLFFVYVAVRGLPLEQSVCNPFSPITLYVVCDTNFIYQNAMNYIREIEKECSVPYSFIDYILKLEALNICVETGNYPKAIEYWNEFFNYSSKQLNCI